MTPVARGLPGTAIFLSIRDKATRLPGKVMRPIAGRTAVEHLIARLQSARLPQRIVMTTSTNPGDDNLAAVAAAQGIDVFRGSEEDKLQRYLDAADHFGIEFAAIVDGDDLFCDPPHIDRILAAYDEAGGDYIICDKLPLGVTAFGIRIEALRRVVALKAENDTEVWGGYFTQTGLFDARLLEVEPQFRRPELRMTLDYREDLAFFEAIFERLHRPGESFGLADILAVIDAHPEIAALNAGVQQLYEAGLKKAAPVRLRGDAR